MHRSELYESMNFDKCLHQDLEHSIIPEISFRFPSSQPTTPTSNHVSDFYHHILVSFASHVIGIRWYVFFCAWLVSLSMMLSDSSIHQ